MKRPILVSLLLALSVFLGGCHSCENDISNSIVSPAGKLKVVVFNRSCGATTGFSTQVSIIPTSSSLLEDSGNILILDGAIPLKVVWWSDAELHVSGLGSAKVFKRAASVPDVLIRYDR